MAGVLFANDFGGIGAAMQSDEALRQRAWEASMASLMRQREQGQAQRNWEAQMRESAERNAQNIALHNAQLAASEADRAGRLDYQNRGLKLSEDYQNWVMKQPSKPDLAAARDLLQQKADGLHDLVERRLPINWSDFADLPEPILNPLRETDTALRKDELGKIKVAEEAATAGRRLRIIKERADALDKAPSSGFRWPNQQQPKEAAKAMRERAAPFVQRYAPLLDPKEGYVMPDPATGDFTIHPSLVKPWMVGTNAPRQLQINTAPAAAPQSVAPVTPRAMNFAAPPTATGTNRPAFVIMRDSAGNPYRVPAESVEAFKARDPGAVLVQ